jgi:sugar lactone lactonase YvrE
MRTIGRNWNRILPAATLVAVATCLVAPCIRAEDSKLPKTETAEKAKKAKPARTKKTPQEIEEQRAKLNKTRAEALERRKKQEEERLSDPAWKPSHEQTAVIKINEAGATGRTTLNNFCLSADGNLLAACSGPSKPAASDEQGGEIRVLSPEGKLLKTWPLEFKPEAICVADDGTIFVAGAGHIAKLDQEGKILLAAKSPQMADLPALPPPAKKALEKAPKEDAAAKAARAKQVKLLRTKLEKAQKEYAEKRKECFKEAAESLGVKTKDQPEGEILEALRKKAEEMSEEERTAFEEKFQLKVQGAMDKLVAAQQQLQEASVSPEEVARQKRAEVLSKSIVTGIAVSKDDVFVACPMAKSYGYAVWRVDREFANSKRIIENLRGCCRQMDIQANNGEVWVAHNAAHKVERYDRDGKQLASFGKAGRKKADEFGGCCEPKNLRFNAKGEVYASESGAPVVIKRFTADGKFLGTVGLPKYESGCVRVTIDVSRDGKHVFILDPGGNAIHVLTEKATEPEKKGDAEKKPEPKDA